MAKALVVYCTRAGETKKIAELIAEGIRFEGQEAGVVNVTQIKKETDLEGFDAYVFGSATYHGEMMQGMKTMLFLAEMLDLQDKVAGSFGAFGWSGEAAGRILDTMNNIFKMTIVSGPLRLKSSSLGGGIQMAQDYGRDIGKKMQN
ncbi:MAG: FprA family A-type flavoprotein [Deltaproteobacteria bacterium]|nr:FprA family A-type flavoprotein [Deltaproteobacteria bacterium]MBW1816973.1 FprA family A-type flavoprotein [Deltaproteobacteria bacterium]MBW2283577.1 FprA family A-type flavoprotein [Deltaproteobacteria bacterium]